MKKVLIGLGIGCGGLILLAVIAMGVGAYWVKGKVEGVAEVAEQMEQQQQALNELDSEYAFTVPPEGTPVKLEEDRVRKYLAVRAALEPVMAKYEAKSKELEERTKGNQASFSDMTEAMGMFGGLTTDLRAAFIEELKKQEMSPKEFHATTQAIYSAAIGNGMAEMHEMSKQAMQETIATYEEQLNDPNLSAEEKQAVQEGLDEAKAQLAETEQTMENQPEIAGINESNAKVLKTFEVEIEKHANPVLDGLLMSDSSEG